MAFFPAPPSCLYMFRAANVDGSATKLRPALLLLEEAEKPIGLLESRQMSTEEREGKRERLRRRPLPLPSIPIVSPLRARSKT